MRRNRRRSGHIGADAPLRVDPQPLAEQFDEGLEALRLHEGVDVREPLAQVVLLRPDHAAHEGERALLLGLPPRFEAGQHSDDPVLSVLANDARVEDDDVGVLGPEGLAQAELLQRGAHPLRVRLVHLASDRPDVVLSHACLWGILGQRIR